MSAAPAYPARCHIENLRAAGWGYREIARAARVEAALVAFIVAGRVKIDADAVFQICCIDPATRAKFVRRRNKRRSRQARSDAARKAWETRRASAAAAKAAAEAAAQREQFEHRRAWADKPLVKCELCGRQTRWQRRGMCQPCYTNHRKVTGGVDGLIFGAHLTPPGDWVKEALCAEVDPDLWFPEKGGSTRDAKQVCMSCRVRQQCLDFALENEERFGIWGGKSERERRAIAKEAAGQESA
jgi:WhiB family redox-sensing transcriptional regulator